MIDRVCVGWALPILVFINVTFWQCYMFTSQSLPFQALSRPDPLAGVALDVRGVRLIDEGIHTVPIVFQGESRLSIGTREMPSID